LFFRNLELNAVMSKHSSPGPTHLWRIRHEKFANVLIVLVLVPLLSFLPTASLTAEESVSTPPPKLDNAIIAATNFELSNFYNRAKANTLTAADVEGAIVALKTLYAHMEEQGLNDWLQKRILANQNSILDSQPTESTVQTLYTQLKAQGVKATEDDVRNSLSSAPEDRARFVKDIKTIGVKGIEQRQIQQLQTLEAELQTNGGEMQGVAFRFGNVSQRARLLHAEVCWYAAYASEAGIFAAFSAEVPPVALAMGLLAGIYGLEAAFLC
jgi:hypothetical protein